MRRVSGFQTFRAAATVWLCLPALAATLGDFNPEPKLPYEATTLEQDRVLEIAKRLKGDSVEEEALGALLTLAEDVTAPEPLRRWAAFRRIVVLCFAKREWDALEYGQEWLAAHPEHPMALALRCALTDIVAKRGHPAFRPTLEQKEAVFQDLFTHHPEPSWDVARAHQLFAQELDYEAGRAHAQARDLRARSVRHLRQAEQHLLGLMAAAGDSPEDTRLEKTLNSIHTQIERTRNPASAFTPEMWEKHNQEVREVLERHLRESPETISPTVRELIERDLARDPKR